MPLQRLQHVIEEADAGLDGLLAGAVEVDLDGDVGLAGLAGDACGARAHCGAIAGSCAGSRLLRPGPVTRQTRLPTSSATSSAPVRSKATPTGRPLAMSPTRKPVRMSRGLPAG